MIKTLTQITNKTGPYHEQNITTTYTQPKSLLSPYRQRAMMKGYKQKITGGTKVMYVHEQEHGEEIKQQPTQEQQQQYAQDDMYADETWNDEPLQQQEQEPQQEEPQQEQEQQQEQQQEHHQSTTSQQSQRMIYEPTQGIHMMTRISGQTVLLCTYERQEPHVLDVYAYHVS